MTALITVAYSFYIIRASDDAATGGPPEHFLEPVVNELSSESCFVRTGTDSGQVAISCTQWDEQPDIDLTAWDAIGEASVQTLTGVELTTWDWQRSDIVVCQGAGPWRVRVSTSSRAEAERAGYGLTDPVERHHIDAWRAPYDAPSTVKRDAITW